MSATGLKRICWALSFAGMLVFAAAFHFFGYWVTLPMVAHSFVLVLRSEVKDMENEARHRQKFRRYVGQHNGPPRVIP